MYFVIHLKFQNKKPSFGPKNIGFATSMIIQAMNDLGYVDSHISSNNFLNNCESFLCFKTDLRIKILSEKTN
jgi:hypothetical protein